MKKLTIIILIGLLMISTISGLIAKEKVANFHLKDLRGKKISLYEHLGNGFVILDFWATWCVPCKKSLPEMDKIHKEFPDVTVMAINTDRPRSMRKAKTYVKTHRFKFIPLFDKNSKVKDKFNVTTVPRAIIIAPNGKIIYDHTGFKKGDSKHIIQKIKNWKKENGKKEKKHEALY